MITLSPALQAAHAAAVQRPAYLVQIDFDPVQRWSSHGTVEWGGHTWHARDITVEGLQVQGLAVRGDVLLGNADGVAGDLILAEGVQDRPIHVYAYDAAATGESDVVLLACAVGAAAEVGLMVARIGLRDATEFLQSPRTYCNEAGGFRTLLPAGTVLRINGQDIRLERRGA